MDTLVLNAIWEPIKRISWQKAIQMWVKGLVEVVEEYEDRTVRSVTFEVRVPSVVRYLRYKKPKRRVVRFSRENVYARDDGRCQYCGSGLKRSEITYDHVVPQSQGGKTTWDNIVVACAPCNQRKRNRTPAEAGMKLRSVPKQPAKMPDSVRVTVRWEKNMPASWANYVQVARDTVYWH